MYDFFFLVICQKYRDSANLWGNMLQTERKRKRQDWGKVIPVRN
jgi:hypothetical protein